MATIVAAIVVVLASSVVGHAVWRLAGLARSWVAPAGGLALLLAAAAVGVELPGRSVTAAVLLAIIVIASIAGVRGDVSASAVAEAAALALLGIAIACLPFAVTGYTGALGIGVNNDMDPHLAAAWWLQTHAGVSKLEPTGYPLGPHALVAALGTGLRFSIPAAFTGLMVAVQALTSLAAFAALRGAHAVVRWVGAVLVGIAYLDAAYYAQGAFKETIEALFVVAFALALREVVAARSGIALGVLCAGMVSAYSYYGLVWPLAIVVVLAALVLVVDRRLAPRRAAAVAGVAAVALVVATAGQAGRIVNFSTSNYANESITGHGNLYHPLPWYEALGIWPTGEFRFDPHPFWVTEVLMAVGAVALVVAVAWYVARRDLAIPAAFVGAALVYWQSSIFKNSYNSAKALAIASPVVVLTIVVAFAALLRRRRDAWRWPLAVLAVAFAVPAGLSGVLALRDARVAPAAHARELNVLRHVVGHDSVLFLVSDDLARWELRGAQVATVRELYATWLLPMRREKPWQPGGLIDFDSVSPATLDRVRYVITTRAAYGSSAPSNFHVVRRTRSYILWGRRGATQPRSIPTEINAAGGILDCSAVAVRNGVAAILPRPILQTRWTGTTHYAGDVAHTTLRLPPGTWDFSLQFVARQGLELTTRGLHERLPANLDRYGPYWPAGTVHVPRATTLDIRVRSLQVSWFGRLLGARGETRGLRTNLSLPLGAIAATRHGMRPRLVPLRRACGRYVDWYRVSGATS